LYSIYEQTTGKEQGVMEIFTLQFEDWQVACW